MNLVYIELDTHAEVVRDFYHLTLGRLEVRFLVSKKVADRLEDVPVQVVRPADVLHTLQQLRPTHVIIGTLHRHFNLWEKVVWNYPSFGLVHNGNFAKLSKRELFRLCFKKDSAYRLKLLFKEKLLASPWVHERLNARWTLHSVPFTTQQYRPEPTASPLPVLIIPGEVHPARRDYDGLIEKFLQAEYRYHLVFLGKCPPAMQVVVEVLRPKHEIQVFAERVSSQEFHHWMQRADLLLCPIRQSTEFFSQTEIYGQTKFSGSEGDALRYGLRAIFPTFYPVNHSLLFNEEEDWEGQIQYLLGQPVPKFEDGTLDEVLRALGLEASKVGRRD